MGDDGGNRRSLKRSSSDEDMSQRPTVTSKRACTSNFKPQGQDQNKDASRLSQGQKKNAKIQRRERRKKEAQQAQGSQNAQDLNTRPESPRTAHIKDVLKPEKFIWSDDVENEASLSVPPTDTMESGPIPHPTRCSPSSEDIEMLGSAPSDNIAGTNDIAGYRATEINFTCEGREQNDAQVLDEPNKSTGSEHVQDHSPPSVPQDRSLHTEVHDYMSTSPKQDMKHGAGGKSMGMVEETRESNAETSEKHVGVVDQPRENAGLSGAHLSRNGASISCLSYHKEPFYPEPLVAHSYPLQVKQTITEHAQSDLPVHGFSSHTIASPSNPGPATGTNSTFLMTPIPIEQNNTSLQAPNRIALPQADPPFWDAYQGPSKSCGKYSSIGQTIQQHNGDTATGNTTVQLCPKACQHHPYSSNHTEYSSEPLRSPSFVHTGPPAEYVLGHYEGAFNRFSASAAAAMNQSPIHGWPSLLNAFNIMTGGRYSQEYLQRLVRMAQSNSESFPLCREMIMNGNKAMMEIQHGVMRDELSNILRSGRGMEQPMIMPRSYDAPVAYASSITPTYRRASNPTGSREKLDLNSILLSAQREALCTTAYGACPVPENLVLLMQAIQNCPLDNKAIDPSLSFHGDSVNLNQTRGPKLQVAELMLEATIKLEQKEDLMNFLVVSRDMMSRYWDELAKSMRMEELTRYHDMEEKIKDEAPLKKPQSAHYMEMVDKNIEDVDMDSGEEGEVSAGAAAVQMHHGDPEQIPLNAAKAINERGCGVRGLGCGSKGKEESTEPSASASSEPSDEEINESGPVQQVSFINARYLPWTHWHCCHSSISESVEKCSHKNRRSWKTCRRAGCSHPICATCSRFFIRKT